jgi:2-oxoglutarate dehydrogenase E2 component (dihydrolipoamide succinyltransferase)
MPALGESVTEGTVTRWLKSEGDQVEVDEPLLEVSTDKVDTEIPSPYGGVLEKILIGEDETAEVGADLAVIGDGSGSSGGDSADAGPSTGGGAVTGGSGDLPPDAEGAPEPEPEAEPASQSDTPAEASSSEDVDTPAEKPTAGTGGSTGSGTSVTLPEMGESVTEGTVTRWLKAVGDEVALDEPLLEVSTDKVDTEIPSPVAGTLLEITVGEDETIEVGAQLGVIGDAGAAPAKEPEPKAEQPKAEAPKAEAPKAPAPKAEAPKAEAPKAEAPKEAPKPAAQAIPSAPVPEGTYVTPVIRKLAADAGVDLSTVKGTGVGGRIRREDVVAAADAAKAAAAEAAAPATAETPAPQSKPAAASSGAPKADASVTALIGTTQKVPRIRQSIAKNMKMGLDTAAQLTTVIEVDVTRVASVRARAKSTFEAREGVKLSFLPFFVKAALEALKVHPVINSTISEDLKELTYHGSVNLGIAVDTPRGLIVPVIKSADDLNIAGLARKIADLAKRTRDNKIGPDELFGGTFTITNTGSVGALFDTPIFVPPQSAILGTGTIVKRPAVVQDADGNDVIAIRSMMYLAMSYDHRNIDGADASRFLGTVKRRIEGGEFEGDLGL